MIPHDHDLARARSRRRFLKTSAVSAAGLATLRMGSLGQEAAPSPGDYKALVCVFLYGGADTFNLLIPQERSEHGLYRRSRGNLAEDRAALLTIRPERWQGPAMALSPHTPEMRELFESGKLSFLANVGPLVCPSGKQGLLAGTTPSPLNLYSHDDQQAQWQRAHADRQSSTGWAGRMLELISHPNGRATLPPGIGIGETNQLLTGRTTAPYVVNPEGTQGIELNEEPDRRAVFEAMLEGSSHALARPIARMHVEAARIERMLTRRLDGAPEFEGLFPESELGAQLRMVARLIAIRSKLDVSRQIFFVRMGGFDTHEDQIGQLPDLYASLSTALGAFQKAIDSLGDTNRVTTFSHTEFGRTLSSNGRGSDHGWGGHAFMMGGPVRGRRIYGTLPDLTIDGPDDIGEGRIIPTTSVDQFAATLGGWFGLTPSQLGQALPNLHRFPTPNLGFLT